ncbi:hypothetical protein RRG08_051659 [Elysia crispata]|uniref:Secreted protein n=1 Tax=Elysia crispata TaxID=231223 RepID=A0AAE1DRA7_9GAST|nr:hypothetical protein RRG08_051659 [Elysia crispata]
MSFCLPLTLLALRMVSGRDHLGSRQRPVGEAQVFVFAEGLSVCNGHNRAPRDEGTVLPNTHTGQCRAEIPEPETDHRNRIIVQWTGQ